MIDTALVLTFIPTFFLVSISPGMCMTLALTLGMTIGVRNTMWMMWGELLGVGIVAMTAVIGVAQVMINHPDLFIYLKITGALFLIYTSIKIWQAKHRLAVSACGEVVSHNKFNLFNQGLFTAISNPKGWAFMVSLLPPFINPEHQLAPQLVILISIILMSEFVCMMIYASGGKKLRDVLTRGNNLMQVNRLSASLIFMVAVWMLVGIVYP